MIYLDIYHVTWYVYLIALECSFLWENIGWLKKKKKKKKTETNILQYGTNKLVD